MTRVAYVCADPGVPVFGHKGSSVHVQEVLRALRRLGVRVQLFASRLGGEPPADLRSVDLHTLPFVDGDAGARESRALAANAELHALLSVHGPFDAIYERYSLWSYAGMSRAKATGTPGILEVNAPLIDEQEAHRVLVHKAEALDVAERAFRGARTIVAVSRAVAQWVEAHGGDPAAVHVLPNGVSAERFANRVAAACPGAPGSFTVGFVGTLRPWHGVTLLADAFARLHRIAPESRLLIVGDGSERDSVETRLAALGVRQAAVFVGAVKPSEIPAYLASMDVGISSYESDANCYFSPLKVVEYMAAGLAVVATRVGQVPELVTHGTTGMLCEPEPAALCAVLDKLRRDAELRASLGAAARTEVLGTRTWDTIVARTLRLAGVRVAPGAHNAVAA